MAASHPHAPPRRAATAAVPALALSLPIAMGLVLALSGCVVVPPVVRGPAPTRAPAASPMYFYPERGQDSALQDRDRYECYRWAVGQSGVDPGMTPLELEAASLPQPAPRDGADVAAVRAQAQVAMAEPDPALRQHALQATLAGCDRATRLVEQLLTLSRFEAGEQLASGPVDLAAVARQVAADLATQALARQQVLELDADQPGGVLGNATLLAVLVRNLLDNAVRYSPVGASIQVSVSAHGPTAQMTVQDRGPGLVPADLARLGQRFFRVTGSSEIGSGLGWSIVQRIATVHGMELGLARSAKLGGLAVTLTAPLARASG